MNIFVLDTDVRKCAEYHVDKHCVKMILETTQLLNNVVAKYNSNYIPIYKVTHKNHPCSIWAGQSRAHFEWLAELGIALSEEYTYRYGKVHKCQPLIYLLKSLSNTLPMGEGSPHVLCMPDQYKVKSEVQSYRNYYQGDKAHIAKWTKRNTPEWWV
jgi:hypothetical protein